MAARGVGGATPLPPQFLHGAPWRPTLWQPPAPTSPPSGLAAAAARLASTKSFRDLVAKAWLKTKQDRPLGEVRLRFTKEHDAAYDFSPEFAWQCPPERETVTGDLPLHALPQLAARRPLAAAAACGGLRADAPTAAAAAELLRALHGARHELAPALAPSDFNAFTELHDHVDAESDALALSELEPEQAALVRRVEAAMRPMVAHLKATIAAPLLGCAEAALHCPRRTWYARVGGAGAVDVVHQDVNGPAYEGWLNVWVLLTDGVYGRPLVLLDPGAVDHDALAWEGERAFTFERMRRGDVVAWRSNRVPHAAAHWPPGEASEADDWSGPARSSFDFRCICRAPS